MQEAVPYKTWLPMPARDSPLSTAMGRTAGNASAVPSLYMLNPPKEDLRTAVKVNPMILIGKRGCCMSHVVKRLLQGLGVNPPVHEVEEEEEAAVVSMLESIISSGRESGSSVGEGRRVQLPVVFIGGQLFGGLDRIMATHITGELTPILKKAGALWL